MLKIGYTYNEIAKELKTSKSTISTVQKIVQKYIDKNPEEIAEIITKDKEIETSKDRTVCGMETQENIKSKGSALLDKSNGSYQPMVVSSISGLSQGFISKEDITSLIEVYSMLKKMHVKKEKVKKYLEIILKLAKHTNNIDSC